MVVIFKKAFWKNFLLTGNMPNEIVLNDSRSTLILGQNGHGKSTILDVICYVLFDKPYRPLPGKTDLVNDINNAGLIGEVEFSIDNKEYRVRRGMKPSLFEIFVDGDLLNQNGKGVDYQSVLVDNILKINYQTFVQVVVLGSASYKPFIQLEKAPRRAIVEDLLGISVFSAMNAVLNDWIKTNKAVQKEKQEKHTIISEHGKSLYELIKKIKESSDKRKSEAQDHKRQKIEELDAHIQKLAESNNDLLSKMDILRTQSKDKGRVMADIQKLNGYNVQFKKSIEESTKAIQFMVVNADCPVCHQEINDEFKASFVSGKSKQVEDLEGKLVKINQKIQSLDSQFKQMQEAFDEAAVLMNEMQINNNSITHYQNAKTELLAEKEQVHDELPQLVAEITKVRKEASDIKEEWDAAIENRKYLDVCSLLLKDGGIKTAIINQYLPIINASINKYLNAMDQFIHFHLDEDFDANIKRKFIHEISYKALSEGQKKRIDLAILFAWRDIARLKSKFHTNLLIMDEIIDSSLDDTGIEDFIKLLESLGDDTNSVIISPRGGYLQERFTKTIRFHEEGGFSKMSVMG